VRLFRWNNFNSVVGLGDSSIISARNRKTSSKEKRCGVAWAHLGTAPDRGCVRRTSRSTPECQAVVKDLNVPLAPIAAAGAPHTAALHFPRLFEGSVDAPVSRGPAAPDLTTRIGSIISPHAITQFNNHCIGENNYENSHIADDGAGIGSFAGRLS